MRVICPILPGCFSRTNQGQQKPAKLSLPWVLQVGRTFFLSALFVAEESQHHEGGHLVYGPLSLFSSTKGSIGYKLDVTKSHMDAWLLYSISILLVYFGDICSSFQNLRDLELLVNAKCLLITFELFNPPPTLMTSTKVSFQTNLY